MVEYKTKTQQKQFYNSSAWQRVRQQVLKRDNNECVMCKVEGKVTTREHAVLEIDHIEELEQHPELALDINNLRTLCSHHHNVRHNRFDGKETKEKQWDDEKW